jgi:methyl-accepting chemotaxis protein
MMTFSVKTRIRLAIGALGAGYVTLLLLVQWTGSQTQAHLATASDALFPAALKSQEAEANFQKLIKHYSDAVLMQDRSALSQADESAQTITEALESVQKNTAFNGARQQQVADLLARFAEVASRSKTVYTAVLDSKMNISPKTQADMAALAKDNQEMEGSLQDLRKALSSDFQAQLNGVTVISNRQRTIGWVLFLIVGTAAVAFTLLADRRVSAPLQQLTLHLKEIAEGDGDLTRRIPVSSQDEIGELSHWFNTFAANLQSMMHQVLANVEQVASASAEISASTNEMARRSEAQQTQTEQIATAMQEMAASVTEVSTNSGSAASEARKAADDAHEGGQIVARTIAMMGSVNESVEDVGKQMASLGNRSDQIGRIVAVIDEIADQTNLLALNAAIEAARAGEQGRGFAVVADEVRKLAERTTRATKEIADMIGTIQRETQAAVKAMGQGTSRVQQGVAAATEAGAALERIIERAGKAAERSAQIAIAANQQAKTAESINDNVNQIARISQESASHSQESAKACGEMNELALKLQNLVSKFKVEDESRKFPTNGDAAPLHSGLTAKGLATAAGR